MSRRAASSIALTLCLLAAGASHAAPRAKGKKESAKPGIPCAEKVHRDIVYAKGKSKGKPKDLRLDVYLPKGAGSSVPVVVWVHGGAFYSGDKEFNLQNPAPLACAGYAVVSIDYRLSYEAVFPAQIQDTKAAIRWVKAKGGAYGLDPERVGIFGSSAGAHLANLAGTTGSIKTFDDPSQGNMNVDSSVKAVADWYGTSDFTIPKASTWWNPGKEKPLSMLLGCKVGTPQCKAQTERANPIRYIDSSTPPFLVRHGDKDKKIPWEQSHALALALKKAGRTVYYKLVKGAGHGFPQDGPEYKTVVTFFDKHLK